ncbi:Hypothetical protein NTJ_06576 [Nesidiocoris tenuis]|uniref:Uncharacterized protein n=1 Tax=Nesidiocoris tenuis TaxID=355587 RepID=A0ABN7AR01_9HEMI|nr:Hypothetical protein NTJ_06576 [Nesidiocoris tenuis]
MSGSSILALVFGTIYFGGGNSFMALVEALCQFYRTAERLLAYGGVIFEFPPSPPHTIAYQGLLDLFLFPTRTGKT